MSHFFWTSGHLGWGLFTLVVFTFLWALISDLIWRLMTVSVKRLAVALLLGWIMGAGLIIARFYIVGR